MKIVIGKIIVFRDRMPQQTEEALAKALKELGIEIATGERDSHYLVIDHKRWVAPKSPTDVVKPSA